MARVTTKPTETTFVLELNAAEAQYVLSALGKVVPSTDQFGANEHDPVYDELNYALANAGVSRGTNAARIA